MRALLEFLGFLAPDRFRRDPAALPAWFRRTLPAVIVVLAIGCTLVVALVRALLS